MTFTRDNFFRNTKAVFTPVALPDSQPDYISSTGSRYWFSAFGVIRWSDHWSHWMESCDWTHSDMVDGERTLCGFAPWTEFSQLREAAAA